MTVQAADTSVRASIVVEAPIERAFSVFTEDFGRWWDPEHHILEADLAEMVFEPRLGGHIYDRGVDGSECRWARVLAYEPPDRLVISWDINTQWKLETDLEKTSEVEVRFVPEGDTRTRVILEHRRLELYGENAEMMRNLFEGDEAWAGMLAAMGAAAAKG